MEKRVKKYLLDRIKKEKCLHMALIDPDKTTPKEAAEIAHIAEASGSAAIMLGGSIGVSEKMLDDMILEIKKRGVKIPVILFPGSISGISKYADAIWFLSVLTSTSVYHIIGAQVQGAPIVRKYNLEPLSLAYIIIGGGGAAGYVSYSRPIPFSKPEIAAAYALAAEYLGFEFVYLEAGSGESPIPPSVITAVKKTVNIPVIVGGGIKTKDLARQAAKAGADIIVTGTILEESSDVGQSLREIVEGIRQGVAERPFGF